ncbi:hypothetical protein HMPREF0198_2358 [Cardiobacterium hominis ATCC 15826]|uniref:Uncharacterized protein n=1 Tax=Cardiobacterium hominis (strain ATCC 15826 / DSM 8339 / NCTC 10426 / 6573) TaxID=638300 RepID=C8NCY0_CARH6|nr:hypothetical protein HMPREF0198_2358 [Cardiobacterium hominis ATCC 15826]
MLFASVGLFGIFICPDRRCVPALTPALSHRERGQSGGFSSFSFLHEVRGEVFPIFV